MKDSHSLAERLVFTLVLGVATTVATNLAARAVSSGWTRVRPGRPPDVLGAANALAAWLGTRLSGRWGSVG